MLSYMSQSYAETMAMQPAVPHIPYAASSREQPGNIITFAQFEEVNLLYETHNLWSKTRDNTESSNKSYDDLTLPLLIIEEEMDAMSSGYESDAEPMSTYILECNSWR